MPDLSSWTERHEALRLKYTAALRTICGLVGGLIGLSPSTRRRRLSRAGGVVSLSLFVATTPAAAQSGFFAVACEAGLGQLFTFALTGAAVFIIAKGMINAVLGLDQAQSQSGRERKSGREGMKQGAVQMAGGIVLPPMLLGVLSMMGVGLGCLAPSLGF